jgi:DNA-binding CsgD family transcriptional regulator/tetratricopeptide (TPR) repeat protein
MTTGSLTPPPLGAGLLERSDPLETLSRLLAEVASSSGGRLVLIRGEAGIGKTALVERFCDEQQGLRILRGACDALFTPRPLGPFLDIAHAVGAELQRLATSNPKPYELATALLGELASATVTILVVEDAHSADEATVDVLRIVARRIASCPALIVVTLRDDELDRRHPLRGLLGELSLAGRSRRIDLQPLSPAAVAVLARAYRFDPDDLYRKTNGNPFFVTEALAAGTPGVPDTVRDAVLARAARLTPTARELIDAASIASPHAELWLLEGLAPGALGSLEECVNGGMLRSRRGGVSFRHELARLAIERSLPPDRRMALHRQALVTLADPPDGNLDLARLAHHAEAADDVAAVMRFAPAAGDAAASVGAYREAADHYARALRVGEGLSLAERGTLLERRGRACYLTDQNPEAVSALEEAAECHQRLGDELREANALRMRAHFLWCPGRVAEAEAAARRSVELLEGLEPGRELGYAYDCRAFLCRGGFDGNEAARWARRALELAEHLDDVELKVNALASLAEAEIMIDEHTGLEQLEQAYALAEQHQLVEALAWLPQNLGRIHLYRRNYAAARAQLAHALRYCSEHGLELYRQYVLAYNGRVELDQGRWSTAADHAEQVLRVHRASTTPSIIALVVTALLRARRGEPGAGALLDEAHELAALSGELPRLAPVACARAETAWLEGRPNEIGAITDGVLELAIGRRASWVVGELASWRRRAGIHDPTLTIAAEPYAAEIQGDWQRAAELWMQIGCPYEAALALVDSDDEDELLRALVQLQELDAQPAARFVARRLRARGVRGLPRGSRPTTRRNPAGLTRRELEVLALLTDGLRNGEIADRLYLSVKTVDSHVAAILRKLDSRNRGEAVRIAIAQDLLRTTG